MKQKNKLDPLQRAKRNLSYLNLFLNSYVAYERTEGNFKDVLQKAPVIYDACHFI